MTPGPDAVLGSAAIVFPIVYLMVWIMVLSFFFLETFYVVS